ncbi:splicing factor 3B subunit 2, putative [Plasmodium gallinaceum]|uniref:Splicing factor 3B subunit 2, putative n=1 Tax=Plasmodium gallinaceum TaxID=5849 RepID=A0A1J1GQJ5_PLAGA|nr:splicing factor 3B subunit 2, putative [Plasmodium gallinaceum]CRG94813.1 splicing factor 3B subunit 2, putative [Plasmodium gallinaceum]
MPNLIDLNKLKELRKTNPKKAKNFRKKLKKKVAKEKKKEEKFDKLNNLSENKKLLSNLNNENYIEYVEEEIDEELFKNFEDVYKKFKVNKEVNTEKENDVDDEKNVILDDTYSDEDDEEEGTKINKENISKKALKLLNRPSVMKLKEFAKKPELVEVWDTTANDPFFFVWLKCLKNSVPVPQHWCQKRKYMHGKRGIEKIPYRLPPYIEDTKISEIRQSIKEKEEQKSLKQKMRDRVRPKLHTMDIDYQTLHDAFFKYATKPKLVKFADIYYEGKEFELKTKKFRPGIISEKLRKALNIEPNEPLPWLYNMQKYGLPPSFPYLNIPGLNCLPHENSSGNKLQSEDSNKLRNEKFDESEGIVYGNFLSSNMNNSNNRYADDFLWGEIDEKYEDSEEEEDKEEKGEENEETKKSEDINEKEKNENMDSENINIDLNENQNEDLLKNNYSSGIYSVVTNSKLNGVYTPYMESGLASVDLTSFISGYETPKYVYNNNYMNTQNMKPYTILQKEEIPISQNNLFSSNIKYKINPSVPNINNKLSNVSEGILTPYTTSGINTPFIQNELSKSSYDNPNNSNVEDIKKELNKFEEISNKVKLVSAQVDNSKKTKKDEKKKKKKKYFKF